MPPKSTVLDGYRKNFTTLCRAMDAADVAMMDCFDTRIGKPAAVVCAVNRNKDGSVNTVPLAIMCEGNPYEYLAPPKKGELGYDTSSIVTSDAKKSAAIVIGFENEKIELTGRDITRLFCLLVSAGYTNPPSHLRSPTIDLLLQEMTRMNVKAIAESDTGKSEVAP